MLVNFKKRCFLQQMLATCTRLCSIQLSLYYVQLYTLFSWLNLSTHICYSYFITKVLPTLLSWIFKISSKIKMSNFLWLFHKNIYVLAISNFYLINTINAFNAISNVVEPFHQGFISLYSVSGRNSWPVHAKCLLYLYNIFICWLPKTDLSRSRVFKTVVHKSHSPEGLKGLSAATNTPVSNGWIPSSLVIEVLQWPGNELLICFRCVETGIYLKVAGQYLSKSISSI